MKKTRLIVAAAAWAFVLAALPLPMRGQANELLTDNKATSLSRKYLRPSLTWLYVTNGSSNSKQFVEQLNATAHGNLKFDYNDLSKPMSVFSGNLSAVNKNSVLDFLRAQKIGNQVLHVWFPADSLGNLTIDSLLSRGLHGATDNDVLKSEASKRNSTLNELGEQLIDRSYIMVVYVKDTTKTVKTSKGTEQVTTYLTKPYLYKVDFNDTVRNTFYAEHYSEQGIDQLDLTPVFVKSTALELNPSEGYAEVYDKVMYKFRKVADFQVKAPIAETHPIKANIGRKENVAPDKRFSVMELRADKNDPQKTYAKRVATVRASHHVIDNRGNADGKVTDLTRFYQIKGRQVKPGQTLVEDPDKGFFVIPEYNLSEASIAIGYRLGKLIKVPGFLFYIKGGVPWTTKMNVMKIGVQSKRRGPDYFNRDYTQYSENEYKEYTMFEVAIGIAKEFNFAGNFAVTPSIEGGKSFYYGCYWDAKKEDYDDKSDLRDADVTRVGGAVKLGYYITRNVQLYATAGYNYWITGKEFDSYREDYSLHHGGTGHEGGKGSGDGTRDSDINPRHDFDPKHYDVDVRATRLGFNNDTQQNNKGNKDDKWQKLQQFNFGAGLVISF